ncbi:hypothetical protein RSAG8_08330, partial [Rhizoctonia solani AG-8 WAC10335]
MGTGLSAYGYTCNRDLIYKQPHPNTNTTLVNADRAPTQ